MTGHRESCDTGIHPHITLSGCRSNMWSPRWVLLFLALVLIPDPGASQIGVQHKKRCPECQDNVKDTEDPDMFQRMIDEGVDRYVKCPLSSNVRFQLNNEKKGIVCAKRYLSWVNKLMECLDGDRKCLQNTSSNSKKEFSKGTNEKPFTTTANAPTTASLNMKPSTQPWDHNIGRSTESTAEGAAMPTTSLVATWHSDIIPLDSNNTNINSQQGEKKSSHDPIIEDVSGKMKHMQTAIISLIAIVLVMVAVGVGLYCRKKKKKEFNSPCNPIGYTAAPSEDSIAKVEDA